MSDEPKRIHNLATRRELEEVYKLIKKSNEEPKRLTDEQHRTISLLCDHLKEIKLRVGFLAELLEELID